MFSFSKDNTKSLFTPWNIRSTKWFKCLLCVYIFGSDWNLFQLIVLLKLDFNCWSNFVFSGVDKVKARTKSFVFVIANLPTYVELVITKVDDHAKIRLTSQLIKGISRVLQKLIKYFTGTTISTFFVLSLLGVFPVI